MKCGGLLVVAVGKPLHSIDIAFQPCIFGTLHGRTFEKPSEIVLAKVVPVFSCHIKKLAIKYKNIDLNDYKINNIFELRFIYFLIGISRTKTFSEGIDFILENSDEYLGWAITDSTYQYIVLEDDFQNVLTTLKMLLKNKNEYIRRLAYLICFKYLKNKDNLSNIFRLFKNDEAYYVQMVESWLLCELYIFYQEETFMFLKETNLDKIIVNKAISKIHDSYRVIKDGKEKAKLLKK